MKPRPLGRGFCCESARRARQVCRARSDIQRLRRRHPQRVGSAEGRAGARHAWLRWVAECGAVPDAGGQATVNDGASFDRPLSMLSDFHVADAELACRRNAPRRFLWFSRGGWLGIRVRWDPYWKTVASGGCQAHASFARTGPPPRPCIARESWRGHGGAALCCASPRASSPQPCGPTDFPSAAQIPREANFSGLLVLRCAAAPASPGVRRARHHAVRITPRPRWARTWINLERTSS